MASSNIRVVIAEDEPPIGRFLRKLVEQTPGFEVEAVCLNGETALEAVKEFEADLIISDIRMSGLSGLELIGAIKKEAGEIHSIIVTGYKMFEYAREAISLRIDAFITKPINPKELRQALQMIEEKHRSAKTSSLRLDLETIVRAGKEEEFKKQIPFPQIRLLIIYYSGDSKDIVEVLKKLQKELLYVRYKEAVVVFGDGEKPPNGWQEAVTKILCMRNRKKTCILVEVEKEASGGDFVARLRQFYRNTVRKLAIPGKSEHLVFPSFCEAGENYEGDEGLLRQTEIAVMAKDYESIQESLSGLFDNWKEKKASVFHMRSRIHAVSSLMERAGILTWDKVTLNDQLDEMLVCMDSYDEIREAVLKCWMSSLSTRENSSSRRDYRTFEQIRVFIEQNLSQNYSLQEISSIFKASQPYIRKVFRQYTGKSYNEYVVEKKIRYAVELMETNPDIYIKDIADILGYDQLYFGTVFKKVMGVSPSQYKGMVQ